MIIQVNTDKNIPGSDDLQTFLDGLIANQLSHYSSQITRVVVHLSDENGPKEGANDKRCVLEARIEGRQPIAVINNADNNEKAIAGAVDKLYHSLNKIFGRMNNHQ